jgi:hypothetical protein
MLVTSERNDVRAVARRALLQLFEPLTGFVIDTGLSTSELNSILRHAAVRSVASRQMQVCGRINISGIAATTGIPRSEISRILKNSDRENGKLKDRRQQSTNRILAAWHNEPKFTDPNGQPADLKLYGRGATFESLVKAHGRGIPTRAMLDELIRTHAVDVLPSQKLRARTSLSVNRGISHQMIKAFGDRATELLSTMLTNMRDPESARFVASVSGSTLNANALPLFRRELSTKSAEFLAEIQESLVQESTKNRSNEVSVTVYYHEAARKTGRKMAPSNKRRNFRRR